ncbi:hypothetical protein PR048_004834 [Dryococelus australis]|uniref:Uncharacterized protein n=1 Tax=Dryococelus australis TaxID=614101 RepID=A0ABQ9I7L6_9NEOP|nr:hypothetical protein PR048_004834 [Dryococelus australis]
MFEKESVTASSYTNSNSVSLTELAKKITVRKCVLWVTCAVKEIRPNMERKCSANEGFKENEETDNEDDNQLLHELASLIPSDEDNQDQEHDDDGENNQEDENKPTEENLKFNSYAEALRAVQNLEESAAFKNCPMLVELMQYATALIQKAIIRKPVKQLTLMNT